MVKIFDGWGQVPLTDRMGAWPDCFPPPGSAGVWESAKVYKCIVHGWTLHVFALYTSVNLCFFLFAEKARGQIYIKLGTKDLRR